MNCSLLMWGVGTTYRIDQGLSSFCGMETTYRIDQDCSLLICGMRTTYRIDHELFSFDVGCGNYL